MSADAKGFSQATVARELTSTTSFCSAGTATLAGSPGRRWLQKAQVRLAVPQGQSAYQQKSCLLYAEQHSCSLSKASRLRDRRGPQFLAACISRHQADPVRRRLENILLLLFTCRGLRRKTPLYTHRESHQSTRRLRRIFVSPSSISEGELLKVELFTRAAGSHWCPWAQHRRRAQHRSWSTREGCKTCSITSPEPTKSSFRKQEARRICPSSELGL